MLSCQEMTELGSDIIDRRLNWRTRMAVMLHTRRCDRCQLYIEQLRLTSDTLKRLPLDDEPVDSAAILAASRQPGGPGQ
ncbi:anti-sigma factor [Pseudomonas sp. MBLB4123]|uniref:anti-sigma factor n=1 Tax=Pseudomonas sp. MBLB4123 TaxID=3451557 RepID=UPI003F7568ED